MFLFYYQVLLLSLGGRRTNGGFRIKSTKTNARNSNECVKETKMLFDGTMNTAELYLCAPLGIGF